MKDSEIETLNQLVDQAIAKLSEHFDSVRVICTSQKDGITRVHTAGNGNWYAQRGACQEFLRNDQDCSLADRIADRLQDEDEP